MPLYTGRSKKHCTERGMKMKTTIYCKLLNRYFKPFTKDQLYKIQQNAFAALKTDGEEKYINAIAAGTNISAKDLKMKRRNGWDGYSGGYYGGKLGNGIITLLTVILLVMD